MEFSIDFQGESINLDPVLQKACKTDIEKMCKEKHAGNAQVTILKCVWSEWKRS